MIVVDTKLQAVSAALAAFTSMLGFVAPWPFVVTGCFFALAGGFAGMFVSPPEERLGIWATLGVALLIGMFAGMMHPQFEHFGSLFAWITNVPLQLVMGVAGLSSRWIAKRLVMGRLPVFKKGADDAG